MAMVVEVIGREIIKPSLPTPSHLKSFQLSRFDQGLPLTYTSIILFYDSIEENLIGLSKNIKESLPKALTCLYPFAGRIKDNISIDCNDEGVDYIEARVNCSLSDFLKEPSLEALGNLVPMESTEMATDPLLLIQVNSFIGEGMALGVNVSHKVADGITLCSIIRTWADITIGKKEAVVPDFSVADFYPPVSSSPGKLISFPATLVQNNREAMRIVFEEPQLNALKAQIKGTLNPTRVEVVLALLWKCAIKAAVESKTSFQTPHVIVGMANMRSTAVPPLPKNACGNVLEPLVGVITDENDLDLSHIVSLLRKAKEGRTGSPPPLDYDASVITMDINRMCFSSLCRMPFYEADFGSGKPIWACNGVQRSNGLYFMDTRGGGGIEAWVKLNEKQMACFEKDEELLAFGLRNPSVKLDQRIQAIQEESQLS